MKLFGAISGLRARLLPMNKLRLVTPTNVLDAASRVTTALTTTTLCTTDPLAQQVALKAAGEELGELHQRLPCGGRQGPVHRSVMVTSSFAGQMWNDRAKIVESKTPGGKF